MKAELVDYAGQWIPRSTQGEFELSHMQHALTSDADGLLSPHFLTDAPRNYGKFSDSVLDDLINKQRMAVTTEERKKCAQEVEKRLLEVVPMVFIANPATVLLGQPWVHNAGEYSFAGTGMYMVEKLWMDKH